jgi:excisionase family DNA binding protein
MSKDLTSSTDQNSRLIKKKELAERLGVSPRTIDNWVASRAIPYLAMSPRLHLFDYEQVLESLRKRYQVDPRLPA